MKAYYEFFADGISLSSTIIVHSHDEAAATEEAKQWCTNNGFDPDSCQLTYSVPDSGTTQIVYAHNGDY